MISKKVSGASLKQAVEEFGSLQKAVDTLKIQKRALEADTLALTKDIDAKKMARAKLLDDLNHLKNTIREHKNTIANLKKGIEIYKQGFDEFKATNKQFLLQYYTVESFVAMLRTSPTTEKSIGDLASYIVMLGDSVWDFYHQPDKLRWLFVNTVLGEHLHCYCCDRCGLKCIINKKPQSPITGYWCPDCRVLSSLRADNSFLEAMLSSSESSDANDTQEQEE